MIIGIWNHELKNPTQANKDHNSDLIKAYKQAGVQYLEPLPGVRGILTKKIHADPNDPPYEWILEYNDNWRKNVQNLLDECRDAGIKVGARPSADWTEYDVDDLYVGLRCCRYLTGVNDACSIHELHKLNLPSLVSTAPFGPQGKIRDSVCRLTKDIGLVVPRVYYGMLGLHWQERTWIGDEYNHEPHIACVSINDPQGKDWYFMVRYREIVERLSNEFKSDAHLILDGDKSKTKTSYVINVPHEYLADDKNNCERLVTTIAMCKPDYLILRGCHLDTGRDKPLSPEQIKELISFIPNEYR